MNNQNGSIMLFGSLLLLCFSGTVLLSMNLSKNYLLRKRELSKMALCMKSYFKKTNSLLRKISSTNKAIKLGSYAEIITWVPVLWGFKGGVRKARKIIMKAQELFLAQYLFELKKNKCNYHFSSYLSPIYHQLKIKRQKDFTAKMRKKFYAIYRGHFYKYIFNYDFKRERFNVRLF